MSESAPTSLWARTCYDTAPEAARLQVEAWRRLGASGRVRVALELSDAARSIARDGERRRDSDAALTERVPSNQAP